MAHSDDLYNQVCNLLFCYIQFPCIDKGKPITHLSSITEKSQIPLPEGYDQFEYKAKLDYTRRHIFSYLYTSLTTYFDGKDNGEYTFEVIHIFGGGMEQKINITISFTGDEYIIIDINDDINPDNKFCFEFPHKIQPPVFFEEE